MTPLRSATLLFLCLLTAGAVSAAPPNIVLILTDNQGAWTLGCYGNPDVQTPRIDRLAREGTLFENCYSSNAVCSPTRATLLTGLIPSQHGVHSYLPAGGAQTGPHAHSTIAEFRTLPKILHDAGYTCGLAGKWHLGGNLTPQEGFTAWTTMPTGHTTTFYNAEVIEDGQTHTEPEYLTDLWTDRGVEFIEANRDRPFFLYLAYNGPYGLGPSMTHASHNRHAAYYADKELKSFPREKMNPWLHGNKNLLNNVEAMRRYAAEISGIDDGIGRIMDTLQANGLDKNTLVVFTADQGLACGQNGFWGMGDHTRPISGYDWTTHTPLIYCLPGKIPAGQRSQALLSNYDFLPTLLDLVGLKDKTPTTPPLPGRSYKAALEGKEFAGDNAIYFEFKNVRSIRTIEWKLITRFPDGPNELYDLKADAEERHNLIDQPQHAVVQKNLNEKLQAFFRKYADPKYDLTKNGVSKADER